MKKEQELSVPEVQNSELPAVANFAGVGSDDFKDDQFRISYLNLVQGTSELAQNGFRIGDYVDSVTKESFGQEFEFCVVKKLPIIYVAYPPYQGKKPKEGSPASRLTWSEDEKIKTSEDGLYWKNGEPINQEDRYSFERHRYVILPLIEDAAPCIITFKGSSRREAVQFNSIMKKFTSINNEPIFARKYKLTSVIDGSYRVMHVQLVNGLNSNELMQKAYDIRMAFEKVEQKVTNVAANIENDVEGKVD